MAASSPAASIAQDINQGAEDEVSFRFCRECSNMLYPKEDRANSQLMFACRTCNFSEPAPSHCVWRNQLTNTIAATAGVTTDVGSDPTVRKSPLHTSDEHCCMLCGKLLDEESTGVGPKKEEPKTILPIRSFNLSQSWDADEMFEDEPTAHESSPKKQEEESSKLKL